MGPAPLLQEALDGGVRLVATSPDYRDGYIEKLVGEAVTWSGEPVFLMAQVATRAWEDNTSVTSFQREFRRSMGHLRRGNVEALLIRNAEPAQLEDPVFREFADRLRVAGYVKHIGVSGHGPDLEKVLEAILEDDLFEIVLFGAHLAWFERIPELLRAARERGKLLVAMKAREAGLLSRVPGWEREKERRRFSPWNGAWDPGFTRRALQQVLIDTPAHNAVLSVRRPEDVAAILGSATGSGER
jgi:aryl-alcohol dehydrogenase-like predicted oxidoreductase